MTNYTTSGLMKIAGKIIVMRNGLPAVVCYKVVKWLVLVVVVVAA